jgi:hypothetical protein
MFGNGFIGLPVAVIWVVVNTSKLASDENATFPTDGPATATGARGPAPVAIPIVSVAELAVEAQRNAPAIPTRARSFAFMLMACARLEPALSSAPNNRDKVFMVVLPDCLMEHIQASF